MIRALALAGMCCVLGPAAVRTVGATPQQQGSVVRVEHRDPAIAPTRGPTTALVTSIPDTVRFSPKFPCSSPRPSSRSHQSVSSRA